MDNVHYLIKECPKILSGIYKLNFPSGKSYIGLSNNIKRRMKEHKVDSKVGKLPVDKAIAKYGLKDFELLEEIPSANRELLQEREKYWIAYYDTTNKQKGYNISQGGDGADSGIYNSSAKLNQRELNEIYDLLINRTDLYIYQIAELYDISSEAISRINNGKRYYNPSLSYPLRPPTGVKKGDKKEKGINNHNSKFTQADIDEIYDLIKNSSLSLQAIADKKGVSYTTISKINRGLSYIIEGQTYPLREKRTGLNSATCKLTPDMLKDIQTDLIYNLDLTFKQIGEKHGLSKDTISRINRGVSHKDDTLQYPLRAR